MDKEKTIQNYMKSLQISREEAEQLYLDDLNDFIGEEGEKMQASAKQFQHREKSDKPRQNTKPKERKIDADKKTLFDMVHQFLQKNKALKDITTKTETEITFSYKDSIYTWKLTKHRTKNKK